MITHTATGSNEGPSSDASDCDAGADSRPDDRPKDRSGVGASSRDGACCNSRLRTTGLQILFDATAADGGSKRARRDEDDERSRQSLLPQQLSDLNLVENPPACFPPRVAIEALSAHLLTAGTGGSHTTAVQRTSNAQDGQRIHATPIQLDADDSHPPAPPSASQNLDRPSDQRDRVLMPPPPPRLMPQRTPAMGTGAPRLPLPPLPAEPISPGHTQATRQEAVEGRGGDAEPGPVCKTT